MALDGLRVVDFSRILAGPFATMLLADLGAEVIKVERPGTGDDTRSWGPPYVDGRATYFEAVNRNKTSVALDLRLPADRKRAHALAVESDVVVENFRPGLLDHFGLGYDALAGVNPTLIFCSITGFGNGAGASLPGYDLLVQALGGLMSITGSPDGEPQKVGVAVVDVLAGLFATVGILAALRHREGTGKGQRVDIALLSASLAALVNQGAAYTLADVIPGRMGNEHPSISPYESFRTAEGELVIAVGNDRQFGALCRVLGAPALAHDPRFATNERRVANRADLREELGRQLTTKAAHDWATELTEVRVPAGMINDVAAAFALADALGLDPIVELERHDGSTARLTRNPIRLSATPVEYRNAAPPLPHPGQ